LEVIFRRFYYNPANSNQVGQAMQSTSSTIPLYCFVQVGHHGIIPLYHPTGPSFHPVPPYHLVQVGHHGIIPSYHQQDSSVHPISLDRLVQVGHHGLSIVPPTGAQSQVSILPFGTDWTLWDYHHKAQVSIPGNSFVRPPRGFHSSSLHPMLFWSSIVEYARVLFEIA